MKANYLLFLLLSFNIAHAGFNNNDIVIGHEEVYVQELSAYDKTGSKDDNIEHKSICETKFSSVLSNIPLLIDYNINTRTGIQWATIKLFNSEVDLQPMGIANQYSFFTQKGIPEEIKQINIRAMHFTLTKRFKLKNVAVMYKDEELDFQCIAEYKQS